MSITGRPLKFQSVEELKAKIDKYFSECNNNKENVVSKEGVASIISKPRPKTISGLAVALGTSRRTLINYENYALDNKIDENFFHTIKEAKQICEADVVEGALMGRYNSTITIFNLKNNHDWEDVKQQQLSGTLSLRSLLSDLEGDDE